MTAHKDGPRPILFSFGKSNLPKTRAVSTGRRNTGMEFTSWSIKVQSFPRSLVELSSDLIEVGLGVAGQVGFLGEVLSQQTVGVFVGAALPWALRIAEVDVDRGGDSEVFVTGQLQSAIPC